MGRFLGGLSTLPAEVLGAEIIKAVVAKSGVEPARIEDVVFADYANPRRPASAAGRPWRRAPLEVPGIQLDRRCGGGLQAIVTAAMMVQTGAADACSPGR